MGELGQHKRELHLKASLDFIVLVVEIIPCLRNAFSVIILAITYPIWGWFFKSSKAKWLEKQPKRFENMEVEQVTNPFEKKAWIKTGLGWGAVMFVVMTFVFPYFDGQEITRSGIVIGLIFWTIGGLMFGYTMKLIMNKKNKKVGNNTVSNT